jgi:hypothetical protein
MPDDESLCHGACGHGSFLMLRNYLGKSAVKVSSSWQEEERINEGILFYGS